MCKRKLLLILSLIGVVNIYSQNATFNGYYISLNNDTLHGTFPNYKQWTKNPSTVNFEVTLNNQTIRLTPFNCKEFVVTGYDSYLPYSGKRMINPFLYQSVMNAFPEDFEDRFDTISVFLRLVASKNNFSIYVFEDKERVNFFYQQDNLPVLELFYKAYQEGQIVHNVTTYKVQLTSLFPERAVAINSLQYSEDGFKKFLLGRVPKNKQQKPRNALIIFAGASMNTVNTSNSPYIKSHYHSSASPSVGIGMQLPIDRNFGRYFFYPNIQLWSFKNKGYGQPSYVESEFNSKLVTNFSVDFGCHLINKSALKWFIAAGVGYDFFSGNELVKQYQSAVSTFPGLHASGDFNILTGVFINNKIMFISGYHHILQIYNTTSESARLSNIHIGIGYKFSR